MPSVPDAELYPEASGPAKALVDRHQAEQPLKLYAGGFVLQRVWLALEEKQIPYQYIEVNPYHKPQSLLSLNPRGDGNGVKLKPLYESNIILEYLEEAYPDHQPRLLPTDPYEKARAKIWMDFVTTRYQPQSQDEDVAAETDKVRQEFLDRLKEGPFFLGDQISLPDLVLGRGLGIPAESQGRADEAVWQRWRTWLRAVEGRRSIRETTSEKDHYLPIYQRYADNTAQSELAKAHKSWKG
ncbi:glutathione S-transferase family protein, partial [Aspergillus novofumigatus IBT 16806]